MRIVIPIVAGVGNAIMAIPMIQALKSHHPDAQILIAAANLPMSQVFENLPQISQILLMKKGAPRAIKQVRKFHPDLCLIPFPSNRWQYNLFAFLSKAKIRILHQYPVGRLTSLAFLPATRVPPNPALHDVDQNLNLLTPLGINAPSAAPILPIPENIQSQARAQLSQLGLSQSDRPIAIHAGSRQTILANAKRWPTQNYADLALALSNEFHRPILLLEGPDEKGVSSQIKKLLPQTQSPIIPLPLQGSITQSAAILKLSSLYLGSDSGLAHLAAAVGTPPITLFAPSDPARVSPYNYRHLVIQPQNKTCCPCFQYPYKSNKPKHLCNPAAPCIQQITLSQVLSTLRAANLL